MEFRGRQVLKFGVLVVGCMFLASTLRNLYESDDLINLPTLTSGKLRLESWATRFTTATAAIESTTNTTALSDLANSTSFNNLSEERIEPEPGDQEEKKNASIAKVTIIFGGDNPIFERALKSHELHNRMHGYPIHVLRQGILNDVWTKPAYILSLLLKELTKPAGERLKWLFWVDVDTVLMNPNIPLDIFLPPDKFSNIHMLVTNDLNGLNNGVFPIRVHPWSVELMSAVIAFTTYRPDVQLVFRDQSALEEVLKEDRFRHNVFRLPQRWFNAYQSGLINETIEPYQVRRGDLLVHFAGVPGRNERMEYWMDIAEQHLPEWELDLVQTSYASEVKEYWVERHVELEAAQKRFEDAKDAARKLIQKTERQLSRFESQLPSDTSHQIEFKAMNLRRALSITDKDMAIIHEKITKAITELQNTLDPLHQLVETARKQIIKESHTTIFAAEAAIVKLADVTTVEPDVQTLAQNMENKVSELKALLVERPDDVEAVKVEIARLQRATAELAMKMQRAEESVADDGSPSSEPNSETDG